MQIKVGKVIIGGDYISIQSMIKNPLDQIDYTLNKIDKLSKIGCDIIRVAVPDKNAIKPLKEIIKNSVIPIVADIHFDHRLAIMAVEAGVHKIRLNPGNITDPGKIESIIRAVKERNIPVRIGINSGSLDRELLKKHFNDHIKTMLESAKKEISYFEKYGYDNIILSFKSSDVIETIKVNELAKKEFGLLLHIGVTEAGDITDGTIKNAIGISYLLLNNIGNTVRVSLTSDEENEVIAAKKILESIGRRKAEYNIISCPTCSRTVSDIENIVAKLKGKIKNMKFSKYIKIAVMGCSVNGPGEAMDADFGVACGKGKSILFKNGKKIKIINNNAILDELISIASEYYEN